MSFTPHRISSTSGMRCLVIQLAKMSDNLQSLMAIRAAKQMYPHLKISYLCRENMQVAAQRIPWIEEVFVLPSENLLSPYFAEEKSIVHLLPDFAKWISPLTSVPWEFIVNWTFSESSSYLTGLLPARVKLGYSRRIDSSFLAADGWSCYFQAVIQKQIRQNIHITDILTTQFLTALQIHLGPSLNEGFQVPSKHFFDLQMSKSQIDHFLGDMKKRWISICLPKKSQKPFRDDILSETYLCQLVDLLVSSGLTGVILIAHEHQKELVQFMQDYAKEKGFSDRFVGIFSAEHFDLVVGLLSRSQLVLAYHQHSVQLASVLGIKIIYCAKDLFDFEQIGPYGNGHVVVVSHEKSPALLGVFALFDLMMAVFKNQLHQQLFCEGFFVLQSRVRSVQEGGGVTYDNLTQPYFSSQKWISLGVGHIARTWYCGWMPPLDKEITRDNISSDLIKFIREVELSVHALSRLCEKGIQLTNELQRASQKLKNDISLVPHEQLRQLGRDLLALEELMGRVVRTHPSLQAFYEMIQVLMHNLHSTSLTDLGKEASQAYQQLSEGLSVFQQWIRFTLQLAKPIIVKSAEKVYALPAE